MKTQLEHWRVLDAVVTCGGVSQAAQQLHKTQSAISYSLKQLEEQSGLALLQLVGRKLQLTSSGHLLLQEARQILQRMALLEQQAGLLARGIESTLIIAVEQISPVEPILNALQHIQSNYPHINIQWHDVVLSETDSAFSLFDADLMISANVPVNHTGIAWSDITLAAVAAPHHPLAQVNSLILNDLTHHTQAVVRDKGESTRDIGWLASPKRWTVDSISRAQELVTAGLAYAWLPLHFVEPSIEMGKLCYLPLQEGARHQATLSLVLNPNKTHGEVSLAMKTALISTPTT